MKKFENNRTMSSRLMMRAAHAVTTWDHLVHSQKTSKWMWMILFSRSWRYVTCDYL